MYVNGFQDISGDEHGVRLSAVRGFRVAETLLEQGSGRVNEDTLHTDDFRSIVCDGATSLGTAAIPLDAATSGGRRAALITAEAFAEHDDLLVCARRANDAIRAEMLQNGIDFNRRESLWSTSFAAVDFSGGSCTWCQTGDCVILVIYDDKTSEILTGIPGQDREVLKTWQRIGPNASLTIHQELAEEIGAVRKMMNRDYGVLNGEEAAMDFLAHGSIETELVTDILLFSDGLFPPGRNPDEEFSREWFVDHYLRGGLQAVRDRVRGLQQDDPGCYRYPRFKYHDDISAVALKRV